MGLNFAEKNVFVTGSFGFLGSWLTKALVEQGANVTTLLYDRDPRSMLITSGVDKKTTVVKGDITDEKLMRETIKDQHLVFHLAAQPLVTIAAKNPLSTFDSNIKGTWSVLEAARHASQIEGVVVASSDKVYGDSDTLPYKEDFPLDAAHPYDVSKACTDMLAQTYSNSYDLPIGIARSGNFYGGGDLNFNRLIPGTIRSLLLNQQVVVRSDGTFVRDYFYVKDAVKAFLALGSKIDSAQVKGQAFNFGTEDHFTVLDVVEKLFDVADVDGKPKILNQASNEIKAQYLDCSKAKTRLNLPPTTSFEQGLAETFEWYQDLIKK